MGHLVDVPVDVVVETVPSGYEQYHGETAEQDILPVIDHVRAYGYECRHCDTDDADDPVLQSEQLEVLVHVTVKDISLKKDIVRSLGLLEYVIMSGERTVHPLYEHRLQFESLVLDGMR